MNDLDNLITEFRNMESSSLILQFFQFVVISALILFLAWLIRRWINKVVKDNTNRYNARKFSVFLSYFLIIILAIVAFSGKVQYFGITIGLLSAGLAFALQEVVLSVAGWLAILSSNLYKPGDRIEINGIKGDVIDIGVTRTTLMEIGEWVKSDNYSGRIVQISNAFVFKGAVHNYSSDFPFVWDEIDIPVKYGSDLFLAKETIRKSASEILAGYANFAGDQWKHMVNKYLIEDAIVKPTLTLKLTDNWIEYNLRYVVDYRRRRVVKDQLYEAIAAGIEMHRDKIAMASATIEISAWPEVTVQKTD
ncbi:MAG: mechanosensitive ion channel [Saprospiraceae bacterium]|nr:mechanosensitive ion channel [Saprospiraceae bacterium]